MTQPHAGITSFFIATIIIPFRCNGIEQLGTSYSASFWLFGLTDSSSHIYSLRACFLCKNQDQTLDSCGVMFEVAVSLKNPPSW